MRTRIKFTILTVAAALCTASVAGCEYDAAAAQVVIDTAIDTGHDSIAVLNERIAVALDRIDELEADSAAREQAQRVIDDVIATRDGIADVVADLESIRDENGAISPLGLGDAISSYLPPPFNVFVPLGLTALGIARSRQVRKAAIEIAGSIEVAKSINMDFKNGIEHDRVSGIMNAMQSNLAKRIVDEAQSKKIKPLA